MEDYNYGGVKMSLRNFNIAEEYIKNNIYKNYTFSIHNNLFKYIEVFEFNNFEKSYSKKLYLENEYGFSLLYASYIIIEKQNESLFSTKLKVLNKLKNKDYNKINNFLNKYFKIKTGPENEFELIHYILKWEKND